MNTEKKSVLRTVRITPTMNRDIELIADYEGRSVANTIQRLLSKAINVYCHEVGENFIEVLHSKPNATLADLIEMQKKEYDKYDY